MKGCLIIHSNIPIDSNWEQLTRAHFAKRKQEIFEKVWTLKSTVKQYWSQRIWRNKHQTQCRILNFHLSEKFCFPVQYRKCRRSPMNCSERIGLKSTYALASDDKNENKYCFWHNKWGFDISNNLVNTSSWTKLFLSAKAKKIANTYVLMKLL